MWIMDAMCRQCFHALYAHKSLPTLGLCDRLDVGIACVSSAMQALAAQWHVIGH